MFTLLGVILGNIFSFAYGSIVRDNDKFLDPNFWSQNPSDADIIDALYGSEGDPTVYTLGWPESCTGMSVVHVTSTGGLPTTLSANTIYVLEIDKVIVSSTIIPSNCSAIVGVPIQGTTIYAVSDIGKFIYLNNTKYILLDNLNLDGYNNGQGGYHSTTNAQGINIQSSSNNTINSVHIYNFSGSNQTTIYFNTARNNFGNNIYVYNSNGGSSFTMGPSSTYNTVNNYLCQNTAICFYFKQSSNNILNNAIFFNGINCAFNSYNNSNSYTNNMKIYNYGGSYGVGSFLGEVYYYGYFNSFGNYVNTASYLYAGTSNLGVGRSNGTLSTAGTVTRDDMVNPYDKNGNYLLDKTSNDFSSFKGGLNYLGEIAGYEYGQNISKQQQPVVYSGTTLVPRGNYDSELYIGQRPVVSDNLSDLLTPTAENYEVNVGGDTYHNEMPSNVTITTNNVSQVEEEPVLGEVRVAFGGNENATFSKLMEVKIPVDGSSRVIVKVKHGGSSEYNYEGLTVNKNVSCNNGEPTSSQYNGEPIRVVDGYATIYTCAASSFIALGVGGSSGMGTGEIVLTLSEGNNTCIVHDYELGTKEVSALETNVSTLVKEIACEFLKNPGVKVTMAMSNLRDGDKEIRAGNFIGKIISGGLFGNIQALSSKTFNLSGQTQIYSKEANTVGLWTGSFQIEGTIPAGTPSGSYTGTLEIIIQAGS